MKTDKQKISPKDYIDFVQLIKLLENVLLFLENCMATESPARKNTLPFQKLEERKAVTKVQNI